MAKQKRAEQLRGQLMLQIAAGRFFRPGVPLYENPHRRTAFSNGFFVDPAALDLPVGRIIPSTDFTYISTATFEVVDRLESQRWDGTDEFVIATGGDELIDDLAYVMTFALNRTFSRDYDQVRRLVPPDGVAIRRRNAAALFPQLFGPSQVIGPDEIEKLKQFMTDLLELNREDFARVMRVIRNSINATRRALDDPTGAYTDLVAALESLADDELTTPAPWDRYDPRKRKIIDTALKDVSDDLAERLRVAVLAADRAGLKRRFVSATLARIAPEYYRGEAVGTIRPPQSTEIERMLSIAYDIRSRRSHVLENLGDEAWVFTDGAETTFEPNFQRIFTLAGLWRLLQHVVRRFVTDAPRADHEPWDYRGSLPGVVQMQLAPQYWIWQPQGLDARSAVHRLNGVAEAFIGWYSGAHDDGFNLTEVVKIIEQLVPSLPDGEPKLALIAIYLLWHQWTDANDHRPTAKAFLEEYGRYLHVPSVTAFTVGLLSNWNPPTWSPDEWANMATGRHTARLKGGEAPLPPAIDVLIQLEAADHLEAVGRHDEAVIFAANAVGELPGHEELIAWEGRLLAGEHDPGFGVHKFLFGEGRANKTDPPETEPRPIENADGTAI